MKHKARWIRWLLALVLGWQLLGITAPAYADTIYIVQPGDTLYRIALRHGVTLSALMAANNLTNAGLIYAGQKLVIPAAGVAVTPPPPAETTPVATAAEAGTATGQIYEVLGGDTLSRIAVKFGVSPAAIMAANGLKNANFLRVGQRLIIPVGQAAPAPVAQPAAAEVTPAPPGSPAEATAPAAGDAGSPQLVYIVRGGDTLWGVSRRFGVSLATLKSVNGLNSDYLRVGQALIIPGAGVTPEVPPPVDAWPPATPSVGIPSISYFSRALYTRGLAAGRDPNAFSVAGDCNSDHAIYLEPVVYGFVDLGSYLYLMYDVNRYRSSLTRLSLAVHGGYNSRSIMDPNWANPQFCNTGEGPFACELRAHNPSVVFIGLGTGDQFQWRDFEQNYRQIIEYAIGHDVLPVLRTKADKLETVEGGAPLNYINDVIRRLGQEYDVPVMDLWLAVQDLPNGGLVWEGGHDFHLSNEGNTRHNIMTLETIDAIWRNR